MPASGTPSPPGVCDAPRDERSRALARSVAFAIVAIGALALAGWTLGVEALKSGIPGRETMKANTALAFVAVGTALALLVPLGRSRGRTSAGVALAVFAMLLGAANLFQDATHVDLGIDELLFRDPGAAQRPGRMAVGTALAFIAVGVALVGLTLRDGLLTTACDTFAVAGNALAGVALVGYVFEVEDLYRVHPFNPIAFPTAVGLWLATLATLAARPARGFRHVLVSPSAGGTLARRLLPAIPIALVVVGVAVVQGADAAWWEARFALALATVGGIGVAGLLVAHQSAALDAVDVRRARAEADLRALNESLEGRVRDRTKELEDALAQVRTLEGLVPMCAWCRRMSGDDGRWVRFEEFVAQRTEARVTHGMCPECVASAHRARGGGAPPAA